MVAAAFLHTSWAMLSAVRPRIMQWMPLAAVGIEPSTTQIYCPGKRVIVSLRERSVISPAGAMIVSW